MKKMTCKQLGGACDREFEANSFDEIAALSKAHGMEMFKIGDKAHIRAMRKMQQLMQKPGSMDAWMEQKKIEFNKLPEK